jgi:hypothetical protein
MTKASGGDKEVDSINNRQVERSHIEVSASSSYGPHDIYPVPKK